MNPCSIDIKDLIEAESSLGLVFQQNLFIGREPSEPANCVTIYDPAGGSVDITANGMTESYFRNPLQIRIRNTSYVTGMELADQILKVLHARNNDEVNDTYYALIRCSNPPSFLAWDDKNRVLIIINFQIQRR